MATPEAVRFADLTGEVCPMTFVKVKLHLEQVGSGQVLEVLLNGEEHMRSVPPSVKAEGHRIVAVEPDGDNFRVFIRKGSDEGEVPA